MFDEIAENRPRPGVGSRTRPAYRFAAALAALCLGLGGCGEPNGNTDARIGALSLVPPSSLLQSRAVDVDALLVRVTIDGEPVETRREGDVWALEATVPPGESVRLDVRWFLPSGDGELQLASWSDEIGPLEADASVAVDAGDYATDVFDADGDGLSNLVELEGGFDPENGDDPGGTGESQGGDPEPSVPDETVVVPAFDLGAGLRIDGRGDEPVWDSAVVRNIDTPVIDVDGEPSLTNYQWKMMHDREFLYLLVLFEGFAGEPRTPWEDSPENLLQDDALNLFFDGDGSRTEVLDGIDGDDRYVAIRMPATEREGQPPIETVFDDRAPIVPDGIVHAACLCPFEQTGTVAGWELRIPLGSLGIEVGRPFGFEVHVDQDLDGGARDERWAWSYPPQGEQTRTEREEAGDFYDFESPARWGTVVLE